MKGILRVLLMTLPRYYDRRSRLAVDALVVALATDYFDSLCSHFVTVVGDFAELQKKVVPWYVLNGNLMNC